MKMVKYMACLLVIIIILFSLFGCAVPSEQGKPTADNSTVTDNDSASSQVGAGAGDTEDMPKQEAVNMVDERFELLGVVFRLAGREEYNDTDTQYQRSLKFEFEQFKEHDAVKYAASLPLGYDAVFKYSVHIQKDGESYVLVNDIASLIEDGRWDERSATEFLVLLNRFYVDSGFADFYKANLEFYQSETQKFVEDKYSKINLEWFDSYLNSENLRCIYSPSSTRHNYGATVNDEIVYCAVSGQGDSIVHEYCHSFANEIADKWYDENDEFRKWCDDTIDEEKLPNYTTGKIIAGEYLTRAYNALYYAENGYAVTLTLSKELSRGFLYIKDVYGMITTCDVKKPSNDKIENILGTDYELSDEKVYFNGEREIRWNTVLTALPVAAEFYATEVGSIFESNTGDVLYVKYSQGGEEHLLIDLGETYYQGKTGYRKYYKIAIE